MTSLSQRWIAIGAALGALGVSFGAFGAHMLPDLLKNLGYFDDDIVRRRDGSRPPRLTRQIMGPVERVAERMWPGVPIIPTMTAGATDGRFLNNAGIPTYGMSGMFSAPGETNAHGLNEKMRVRSLYEGRDFLDAIVREYARQ